MAPGVGELPPAIGAGPQTGSDGVPIVARLGPYIATLPGRSVRLIKLALLVLEWLPFPWRFSRADLGARQDFLRRLEASSSGVKQDLVLMLKVLTGLAYASDPRVERVIGYEATCRVASADATDERSEPPSLGDLAPQGREEECDVAIVGSGAGGAVAAALLAEAGLDVLVLEAGPHMNRETYPREPLAAITALYRDGGLTVAEGRPSIPTPVGRAVGGTTVINSGTCLRAPEPVLAAWAREHGIEWARHLSSDFAEAEEMLNVRPVDPERMGRNGQLLRAGAEALGASHAPLPRNAGDCVQCSSCPIGCRLDAKRAMHVSYLPRAVAAGARIRAGVEARRISFDGAQATGVECVARTVGRPDGGDRERGGAGLAASFGIAGGRDGARRLYTIRARKAVILAGGAFGTPELLLRSGFRSPSGELGRNLRIHPACWVGARFAEEVRGWEGVMQSYAVDEWQRIGLLLEATFTPLAFGGQWLPGIGRDHQQRLLEFGNLASTGVHLSDRSAGRVALAGDGSLRISYRLTRDDARLLSFGIARAAELLYAAGAVEVFPQISGLPTIARERIGDLETSPPRRSALRLEAFHLMGTARIDADPRRGVAGPDGAVHGARDLYVADASALPSSIGVNPMLTIIAFAARIARGLTERLS